MMMDKYSGNIEDINCIFERLRETVLERNLGRSILKAAEELACEELKQRAGNYE